MSGNIWIGIEVKKSGFARICKNWRSDRDRYIREMTDHGFGSHVDYAYLVTSWSDQDGVFLIKEPDQKVEDAKKQLHPQMHKYLNLVIENYGVDEVTRKAVLLKIYPKGDPIMRADMESANNFFEVAR